MERLVATTLSVALVLFAPPIVFGQNEEQVKSLMQQSSDYIQKERAKPPYRESIRKTLLDFQKKTGSECKDLTLDFDSAEAKDELEDLVELDGTGKAIAGGWREKVPGGVCGENRMLNTQVNVTPHGLQFKATLLGEARGDLELQTDTLGCIVLFTRALGLLDKKSCHSKLSTRVTWGQPGLSSKPAHSRLGRSPGRCASAARNTSFQSSMVQTALVRESRFLRAKSILSNRWADKAIRVREYGSN